MTDSPRLQTVRRGFEAFNDFGGELDAEFVAEAFDPGIEVLDFPDVPGRRSYRGHEGISEFFADLKQNWRQSKIEVEEMREHGDAVIVLGTQFSVGAMTDVPVSTAIGEVVDFEGDRIVRIRMFRDHAAALEAAGV